jgi:hypothetical protein
MDFHNRCAAQMRNCAPCGGWRTCRNQMRTQIRNQRLNVFVDSLKFIGLTSRPAASCPGVMTWMRMLEAHSTPQKR